MRQKNMAPIYRARCTYLLLALALALPSRAANFRIASLKDFIHDRSSVVLNFTVQQSLLRLDFGNIQRSRGNTRYAAISFTGRVHFRQSPFRLEPYFGLLVKDHGRDVVGTHWGFHMGLDLFFQSHTFFALSHISNGNSSLGTGVPPNAGWNMAGIGYIF